MGARMVRYPIMGLETQTVLDRVTKQIVTIFSETCNKGHYQWSLPTNQQGNKQQ